MPNISTYYGLELKQKDLEFVDVALEDDNCLFINPRLIENSKIASDKQIKACLDKFFGHLVLYVSAKNRTRAFELLAGVQEPKETRLGFGNNNSNGRSAGPKIKGELIEAIWNNQAIRSRNVKNLSDIIFFIPNVGIDRISDITTKIIKRFLIEFTQEQCKKFDIEMKEVYQKGILEPAKLTWKGDKVDLPVFNHRGINKAIIFVPKRFICSNQDASSNFKSFFRFARNFIINSGNGDFLKHTPRNGKDNSILAKDFDGMLGDTKEELSKWVIEYPDILSDYRLASHDNIKPLSDQDIGAIVYRRRKVKS